MRASITAFVLLFGPCGFFATAHADDRLIVGMSAGTPFYIGGGTSVGTLETRNNEPPGGYTLALDVSYCVIKYDAWCIGPVAQLHHAYYRGQIAQGADFTQGSLQAYGAQAGGRVSYAFDSRPAIAQLDVTLGPTYVDIHDLSSNGSAWVPEAALQLTVLYNNPNWYVDVGPYVKVSYMFDVHAAGEPGKKDFRGDVTTATVGIRIQY